MANDVIMKIELDVNNPADLSKVNAMLWLFNASNNSYSGLKDFFDKIQKKNSNKIPYVLVVYYDNENIKISDDILDGLMRDFKCNIFEIRSFSSNDIEDIFFYLAQKISEKIISSKPKTKRKLKKKRKDKAIKRSKRLKY